MSADGDPVLSRRQVLKTVGAGAAATAAGAGAGTVSAQEEPDYGGWFDDVDNYDGTTDMTGQSEVTVEVGAQGNGGTFAFEPAAVRVSPGTTVTFEWTSNTHNVLVEEQPGDAGWGGHEPIENSGFSFSHTFETTGIYKYYCEPHLSLGMKGAVVVDDSGGGSGSGSAQTVPAEYGDWFSDVDNYDGTTADMTGQSEVAVDVGAQGNGGSFAFDPPAVRVSPGTTVTFEWSSDTHNVLVEDQPGDAGWGGHEPIENTGFSFSHTFETPGVYTYYCDPHLSLGMKGAVVVGAAPGSGGAGGGAGGDEPTAGELAVLQYSFGLLGAAFLAIVGALGYVAINKRRFPPQESLEPAEPTERAPVLEAPPETPTVELDHHSFEPNGTLSLVLVYFAILVLMWVFMYFVEFLGNGPTVVG